MTKTYDSSKLIYSTYFNIFENVQFKKFILAKLQNWKIKARKLTQFRMQFNALLNEIEHFKINSKCRLVNLNKLH